MMVMIMAGGTGGHVYPALAVARALLASGHEVVWLGTRAGLEARVVPAAGIEIEWLGITGLRGKGLLTLLLAPLRLLRALAQALAALRRRHPDVVLGMGGFVSGPGGLAAWLTRRPLVIHEQNGVAGTTNRVLSRFAARVLEAFPGSFGARPVDELVGNPVREDILGLPEPAARFAERSGPLRVLVVGGSQGALALNTEVPRALAAALSDGRIEVRHQTGELKAEDARTAWEAEGLAQHPALRCEPYIEDMAAAYAWADLAVCRAGALTVAELAAVGLGAVLVPFPHAIDDHQTVNASHMSKAGAALLLPQAQLADGGLAAVLGPLLADRARCLALAETARRQARVDATDRVLAHCLEVSS